MRWLLNTRRVSVSVQMEHISDGGAPDGAAERVEHDGVDGMAGDQRWRRRDTEVMLGDEGVEHLLLGRGLAGRVEQLVRHPVGVGGEEAEAVQTLDLVQAAK